jgi:hypothetical protein
MDGLPEERESCLPAGFLPAGCIIALIWRASKTSSKIISHQVHPDERKLVEGIKEMKTLIIMEE